MSTMTDALNNANLQDELAPIKLQFHRFPFGVVNPKTPLGTKIKDVESDERFIQQLFNNYQVQQLNLDTIELGGAADKNDRWAFDILSQYADKAYAFVEPVMVPRKVGFQMVPFYFAYDPTLRKLDMKMGLGLDIPETFKQNGIEFSDEEIRDPMAFNNIMNAYFNNTPIVVVIIGQKMPLYEYTDRAWRFSAIKKDPATMAKLQDCLDNMTYPPRDDKYYFIRSTIKTDENGRRHRVYYLRKENKYNDNANKAGAEDAGEETAEEVEV